ncbi:uncharacterized protein LOC106064189 isoform X1 [Biomphalaria glabrata]|uniref:Uncharacterized protein LOC106064189 isoform X1 n=1 Tax=Biomphalaria glabrata TaxID=6526 RepID=A0A9W3AHX4_BIOGL|nr:uncharacterized protein LOC106064189 isoform X1 [Biomphalaria glabrata]KAI8773675.1 Teneurin-3 [Biomphalaria glabrata]
MFFKSLVSVCQTLTRCCLSWQFILTFSWSILLANSHVILTYPPARKYSLDFLDNVRTRGPCGMIKENHNVTFTELSPSTALVVQWHLAYTHRGGVYIELRDSKDKIIKRYPDVGWTLQNDVSATSYTIVLPPSECYNCTLRLVKQATDWGEEHVFWSCADIHLTQQELSSQVRCNTHGTLSGSQCVCRRTYVGDRCQFQNECVDDTDCSNHGHCTDTNSTSYPRLQCYCHAGWFGRRCEKESPVQSLSDLNYSLYNHKVLSADFEFYYRIIQESQELEAVIKSKSDSWLGIGWRSFEADESCRQFPVQSPTKGGKDQGGNEQSQSCVQGTGPPDSGTCPQQTGTGNSPSSPSTSHAGPNPCDGFCNSSTGCVFNVEWIHQPKNNSLVFTMTADLAQTQYMSLGFSADNLMPNTDIVIAWRIQNGSVYLSDRWVASKSMPVEDTHNDLTLISGEVTAGTTSIRFSRLISPSDVNDLNLNISGCIYLLTAVGVKYDSNSSIRYHKGNRGVSSKQFCFDKCPVDRGESLGPITSVQENLTTEAAPLQEDSDHLNETGLGLHEMDCTDVIIGSALWNTSRIGDYYTRDRSTPLFDQMYGGVDSLTAAIGYQTSTETVILFRRKVQSADVTDWPIEPRPMHVVWARGQHRNDIIHRPPSAYEMNEIADKDYYRPNELKYHGAGGHRGDTAINFHEVPPSPAPVDPPKCLSGRCTDQSSCPYQIRWAYESASDSITFQIMATVEENQWVAVGFSNDEEMPNTDVIAAYFLPDSQSGGLVPHVTDRYAYDRSEPKLDAVNNVQLINATRRNGVSTFLFSRPARTGDAADIDLHNSQNNCPYVFYGIGGSVSPPEIMDFHPVIPTVAGRICFGFCSSLPSEDSTVKPHGVTTDNHIASVMTSAANVALNCTIRLTNLNYNTEEMGEMTRPKAKELKVTLELELEKAFRESLNNINKVTVQRLRPGSVLVDFSVAVTSEQDDDHSAKEAIKKQLQKIVEKAELADFVLDTKYLAVDESQSASNILSGHNGSSGDNIGKSEIIIIVVAVVLCLVAVAIVTYKFCVFQKSDNRNGKLRPLENMTSLQAESDIDLKYSELMENVKTDQNVKIFEPHVQHAYENPGYLDPKTLNVSRYV